MRRARVAGVAAVAALGLAAAVAAAQSAPPTVTIAAGPTSVALQSSGPVPAGPTRFQFTREASDRGLSVYILLLNAGVSLDEFQAALRADDQSGGELAVGLVSIQASISMSASQTSGALTFALKPGLTYVMISEPDTDDGPPPSRGVGTFTTSGDSNGATAPAPAATVTMQGLRFKGSKVLPRRGTVRFENRDGVPHFAAAIPLRRGVSAARVGRVLRSDNERAFGRIVAGDPVSAQNVISGGGTANDQELQFPKAGKYALVCFFDEHHKLGMYRVVTVR